MQFEGVPISNISSSENPAYPNKENSVNYYLDESGDATLFDKHGRVIIGKPGKASRYSILGMLNVKDKAKLSQDLLSLRQELTNDPRCVGTRSFRPGIFNTSDHFHACNDPRPVRDRVFDVLAKQDVTFSAVMIDKMRILAHVIRRNEKGGGWRYNENWLYAIFTRCLFTGQLHQYPLYKICFATRGNIESTDALSEALHLCRRGYLKKRKFSDAHVADNTHIEVSTAPSRLVPALQAVDYFNWALNRMIERHDNRYFERIRHAVGFINERDDFDIKAGPKSGVWYTNEKELLVLAALSKSRGI